MSPFSTIWSLSSMVSDSIPSNSFFSDSSLEPDSSIFAAFSRATCCSYSRDCMSSCMLVSFPSLISMYCIGLVSSVISEIEFSSSMLSVASLISASKGSSWSSNSSVLFLLVCSLVVDSTFVIWFTGNTGRLSSIACFFSSLISSCSFS